MDHGSTEKMRMRPETTLPERMSEQEIKWAGEMAQGLTVLATQPDDLNWIPRTDSPKFSFDLAMCAIECSHHPLTQAHIRK